ncbi:MAG: hypothetical protein NT023_12745 [Armatimonadetes bacterium]|nr:hypothetical protein [Armatimonadota bacterium]
MDQIVRTSLTTYVYDAQHRITTIMSSEVLLNYPSDYATPPGEEDVAPDITTFTYDSTRTRLLGAVFSSGERITYTYSEDGKRIFKQSDI